MPSEPLGGFVLAGGQSSRMGQNKALLAISGEPLVACIARQLTHFAERVTLVGDPAVYAGLGFPVIPDIYPGCGPLAGIHAALRHTRHDWVLIAACDMPAAETAWAELHRHERRQFDVVMAAGEPLAALYHRRCLSSVEAALAAGRYKVADALAGSRVLELPIPASSFRNLNTPEEWRQFVTRHV